ncbi:hypothetical protein VPH35_137877 [Triticum aestivum]
MLSAEKWKKHSSTGGQSNRRIICSSLANGRGTGTGQASGNQRSSTGGGVNISASAPPLRFISDQVLKRCQKAVPSATAWLSDMATKTPSASSVTCPARTGRDPATASAPTSPSSGKKDQTTRGMYSDAATSATVTPGATAWTNSAPSLVQRRETVTPPSSSCSSAARRPAKG